MFGRVQSFETVMNSQEGNVWQERRGKQREGRLTVSGEPRSQEVGGKPVARRLSKRERASERTPVGEENAGGQESVEQ